MPRGQVVPPTTGGGLADGDLIGLFTAASLGAVPEGTEIVQTSGYNDLGVGAALYVYDAAVDAGHVAANPRTSFLSVDGRGWTLGRQTITPFMLGCVGDGSTDDLAALQAFNDYVFDEIRAEAADFSGDFGIDGQFFFGPSSVVDATGPRYNIHGDLHLQQLSATFETCRVRNLKSFKAPVRITASGIGSASFATRTCGVGIALENCQSGSIAGLRAYNFWFCGIATPTVNNNNFGIDSIIAQQCGSGSSDADYSLEATFSGASNTGSSGSTGQRTVLSGVSAFPDAAIETYDTVGGQFVQVRINGYLYKVTAMDSGAGTVTVYPWLDPAVGTAGDIVWVFGGGLRTSTSDANVINVRHMYASVCGRGASLGSQYGARIGTLLASSCGTGLSFGNSSSGSSIGGSVAAYYPEGNDEDIVVPAANANVWNYINASFALDMAKVWATGSPRLTGGVINGGELGVGSGSSSASGAYVSVAHEGILHRYTERNLAHPLGASATFVDHAMPPRIFTQARDSQTVTLTVQGTEWNRLFGYRGSTWRYVGSGASGAPTGTFTFVPPSGGTVNGGAVDASAAFSGFVGPVDFAIYHTDTAQLTWIVRPLGGSLRSAAVSDPAAITSAAATTAAAAPTQAEFNALVAEYNKTRTDLASVRTQLVALNTSLKNGRVLS